MQLRDANSEIAVSELVGNVEAEGTELATFQTDGVEQAQGEQQQFERGHFSVFRSHELCKLDHLAAVRTQQVCLQPTQHLSTL